MEKLEKAIMCTLHSVNGIGNKRLWKIKNTFGSFQAFFTADSKRQYACLPASCVEGVKRIRQTDPLKNLQKITEQNIKIVSIEEKAYPPQLRTIYDPPYLLYYRGDLQPANQICIAVVGSRNATPYGITQAHKLGSELAKNKITVISGMARGIDTAAHKGALNAQGPTIAVLGSGINVIYPPENTSVYDRITADGAVISEFPLDTRPEPGNFPTRNRIISGLARGVIIVEARQKSGALITADFALEQGRDVFAVPGPVGSKSSEGTNNLIKQGAKLVTGIDDILAEYFDIGPTAKSENVEQEKPFALDKEELQIIQCMGYDPIHFEEIIKNTSSEIGILSTLLFKLEFQGIVKSLPGNYYVRIK